MIAFFLPDICIVILYYIHKEVHLNMEKNMSLIDFASQVTSPIFSFCYRTATTYQAAGQVLIKTEQPSVFALKARSGAACTKAVELIKRQTLHSYVYHSLHRVENSSSTHWMSSAMIQIWRECGKIVPHLCTVNRFRDEVKYILDTFYRSMAFRMLACGILNRYRNTLARLLVYRETI